MAENAPLPDDLSQWPSDPFAILGVGRECTAAEVKRAYIQRIRQFKPEHHPEQFQVIRAAYEHAEQIAKWRAQSQRFEADRNDVDDSDTNDKESPLDFLEPPALREHLASESLERPAEAANPSSSPSGSSAGTPDAACAALWQKVCAGEEAAAYKDLMELHFRAPGHVGTVLQLYWLCAAAGPSDEARKPYEWLIDGLLQHGLGGSLWELLRREFEQRPAEALTPAAAKLFAAQGTPGQWLDLAQWRWHAAALQRRPQVIDEDLQRLRERMVYDDDEMWARMLFLAADYFGWFHDERSRMAFLRVRHELESLVHLQQLLEREFTRLDLLVQLAGDVVRLDYQGTCRNWLTLVSSAWTRPWSDMRRPAAELVREIAQSPTRALGRFDQLLNGSPAVVSQLGQLVQLYAVENPQADREQRTETIIQKQVLEYVGACQLAGYRAWRKPLLDFCTYHAIDPLTVAQIYDASITAEIGATDLVQNDGPLRFVYAAHRAYWG